MKLLFDENTLHQDSLQGFRSWYDTVRMHSTLQYQMPCSVLLHTAILSNNMVEKIVA